MVGRYSGSRSSTMMAMMMMIMSLPFPSLCVLLHNWWHYAALIHSMAHVFPGVYVTMVTLD